MKAVPSLLLLLTTCILLTSLCHSDCMAEKSDGDAYRIAVSRPGLLHKSAGDLSVKSATDSFYLYGGPGTVEGRFQSLPNSPGGAPDAQGWIGVDLTEQTPKWHASTINSSSLGDGNPEGFTGGAGNHGIISHDDQGNYEGYGNGWDDWLVFGFDPSALDPGFDPSTDTTTVRLTCEYKHFTEELYDYLSFEWNQNGVYHSLFALDGNSYNEVTGRYEKRDFDSDAHGGIVYQPGTYAGLTIGPGGLVEGIQLRIRVMSDGAWSDEDGLFTTDGRGAAALDNIQVSVNGTPVSFADFEHLDGKDDLGGGDTDGHNVGAAPGTYGWMPIPTTFVGDFSKIYGQFQDIDPCRDNVTPLFTFINDGTAPNNAPSYPIPPAISPTWSYGVPGGYVVEYNGGLSGVSSSLKNYIWSPEIDMDLPGLEDDVANGGMVLGFSRYNHLPLLNAIFALWHVRSWDGSEWTNWRDNNFIYYSEAPAWQNEVLDISHLIPPDAQRMQISLGVEDLAELFFWPNHDATPSPLYDNVYLKKYRIDGPSITARTIDLASDCFPVDGSLSGSCRFDANLSQVGWALIPGDSIVATILPGVPGAELFDPEVGGYMMVSHLANPEFAVERSAALAAMGTIATTIDPITGWPIYSYMVAGQKARNQAGVPVEGRYFWDLLDGTSNGLSHISDELEWIFPGDVIQYRIESWTTAGSHGYLPAGASGFGDFSPSTAYPRTFTVRALPTMVDGDHPRVLFWNDAGHGAGENEYLYAFRQLCYFEGQNVDTYTTKGPSSGVSNGLGSAGFHGATAQQLAGYDVLIYALGNLGRFSISDGSGEFGNDMGNDLATLSDWANADADRYHAYFGDDFAFSMVEQGSATQSYLNQVLGVDFLSDDVGPVIGGQVTPAVAPSLLGSPAYISYYAANGGCLLVNDFDHIGPYGGGPVLAHEFLDPNFNPYPTRVAGSIEWLREDGNANRKHTIVFPYDLSYVERSLQVPVTGIGGRAALLQQVLWSFGLLTCDVGVEDPTIPPTAMQFYVRQNHPNPFNPSTRISFSLTRPGKVRVTLYNVRGERVAVLLDEVRDRGPGFVDWHGRDDRGADVASGIYLYKVEADGQEVIKKMALLR